MVVSCEICITTINLMPDEKAVEQRQFFTANSHPHGLTYDQWTVMWWQRFLSTQAINPILDESGKFASVNQPRKDLVLGWKDR